MPTKFTSINNCFIFIGGVPVDKKILYVTYCSKKKLTKNALLPAVDRYYSDRIKWVHKQAKKDGASFAILSGFFGLIGPRERIPYYDYELLKRDIPRLVKKSKEYLDGKNVGKIKYFTEDPKKEKLKNYLIAIKEIRNSLGISLKTYEVKSRPKKFTAKEIKDC